ANLRQFYASQLMTGYRDYPRALALLKEATRLKPDNAGYWNDLGVCYGRMEAFEKAIEPTSRAIQLEPKEAVYWSNRGFAKAELGRWKEAAADYARAVQLQPGNTSNRILHALCCLSADSITEYRKACAQLAQMAEQSEVDRVVIAAVVASQYA